VVTRPRMLEQLRLLLANGTCIFFSPRFLEECRTFIRHPDGSCAAAPGGHDDTVMAMAIAQAVRAELRIAPAKSPEEAQYRLQQAA
jgi:hypothetical protein